MKKVITFLISAAIAMCLTVPAAAAGQDTALAAFCFTRTAYETGLNETYSTTADAGYMATAGTLADKAVLTASVSGTAKTALTWSSSVYGADPAPVMEAGDDDQWGGEGKSCFIFELSTKGYENLTFSANLGGTKKGPKNYQLQYSLNGSDYTTVTSGSISANKTLESVFNNVELPAEASNREKLYIRLMVANNTAIGGGLLTDALNGGEAAINNVVIAGTAMAGSEKGKIALSATNADGAVTPTITNTTGSAVDAYVYTAYFKDSKLKAAEFQSVAAGLGSVICDSQTTDKEFDAVKVFLTDSSCVPLTGWVTPEIILPPTVADNVTILLSDGASAITSGDARCVEIDGDVVTLTIPGTYIISGQLSNGQLVVDLPDSDNKAEIDLCGVNVTCTNNAPFVGLNGKLEVSNKKGYTNTFTDGAVYASDAVANACFYSADDLQLKGAGNMTVNGHNNNGIGTKDDLEITKGTVNVSAPNNAIKGNDSVTISGGTVSASSTGDDGVKSEEIVAIEGGIVTVNAACDGIKANDDTDTIGQVTVTGGTVNITAGNDAIQATAKVDISGGEFDVKTGGGYKASGDFNNYSYKGIKCDCTDTMGATGGIFISGGTFKLNCLDDAVHSDGNIYISGGSFEIYTKDDGVHADTDLYVSGTADVNVKSAYEGLEAFRVYISGGESRLVTSDDGINGAGGDGSGTEQSGTGWPNRPGGNADGYIEISGGYVYVNANGDGIDANGCIRISGGTILVSGEAGDGNGALDCGDKTGDKITMTGGFLIATGYSRMAAYPNDSSNSAELYCMLVNISGSTISAGTIVDIKNSAADSLVTFAPPKAFNSVVFCCPQITTGTYTFRYGGSVTGGEQTDGLYTSGTYTGGTSKSVSVTSKVPPVGGGGKSGM